jgi:DNA repair exonuclease SbcCD ATPase subunit
MRNFTAVYADLTPEEVAAIMANPKCRLGSHADLAAERAAGQAREAKLRDALRKIATNTIHWYASIQDAEAALAIPADDTALKETIQQAKRDALLEAADEIEQLRQRLHEVSVDWQCSQAREAKLRAELNDATLEQAWAERNAAVAELHNHKETSQAREAALRGALQTFIDEHEDCEDSDDWAGYMCSIDAVHEAENALAMPSDDTALKKLLAHGMVE